MTASARLGLWSHLLTLLLTLSAATASLAILGLGPWWPFGPLWLTTTGFALGALL